VRACVDASDPGPVIRYETDLPGAALSAPTPDHFLPLIYTLAQRRDDDAVAWKVGGFDGGSISMLALQLG
jgi:4,5-DOPA dioxygenase extradiol